MILVMPKYYSEGPVIPVNFLSRLPTGVTLSSAVATCTVISGTDASPSSLIGSATVSSPIASVPTVVNAGTAGVLYNIAVVGLGSDGKYYTINLTLAVLS